MVLTFDWAEDLRSYERQHDNGYRECVVCKNFSLIRVQIRPVIRLASYNQMLVGSSEMSSLSKHHCNQSQIEKRSKVTCILIFPKRD